MHLLHCKNCGDIFNLKSSNIKTCGCGDVGGIIEENTITYFGEPYPLEVEDAAMVEALQSQVCTPPEDREKHSFTIAMLPLRKPLFIHQ